MSNTVFSLWLFSMRAIASPELCNGIDDDGDTFIDEGPVAAYNDSDGDGRGDRATVVWSADCASRPAELVDDGTDCKDNNPDITPDVGEFIDVNGIDENCDGSIDEDVIPSETTCSMLYDDDSAFFTCDLQRKWTIARSVCSAQGYHLATIDDSTENDLLYGLLPDFEGWIGYYENTSGDWVWESGSSSYENFAVGEPNGDFTCARMFTSGQWYDAPCDQDDYRYPYICEADCVAEDTFADTDADGLGDPGDVLVSCTLPAGRVWNNADCDDTNSDITTRIWFEDLDHDGYGSDIALGTACDPLSNSSETKGDCNDADQTIHPDIDERCDTDFDDDCDGLINDDDENLDIITSSPYYPDKDNDTYGAGEPTYACLLPDGFADNGSDCDDDNNTVYPGATDLPDDSIDQDCDGTDTLGDPNGGDEFPQTGGKFNGRNRTGTVGCTCEQPARAPGLHALVLLALLASARRHNRQPPL